MDPKRKAKKNDGAAPAKTALKDLRLQKEQANKVQGGGVLPGPEDIPH